MADCVLAAGNAVKLFRCKRCKEHKSADGFGPPTRLGRSVDVVCSACRSVMQPHRWRGDLHKSCCRCGAYVEKPQKNWWICGPCLLKDKQARRAKAAEREGRQLYQWRSGDWSRHPDFDERQAAKLARQNARQAWEWWLTVKAPAWWIEESRFAVDEERRLAAIAKDHERRARCYSGADGTIGIKAFQRLYRKNRECFYCGRQVNPPRGSRPEPHDASIDHVVPLSRGGLHAMSNIVIACRLCNQMKGNFAIETWLARLPADRVLLVRAKLGSMPDDLHST